MTTPTDKTTNGLGSGEVFTFGAELRRWAAGWGAVTG
jgi:hypothetical protein